MTKNVFEKIDIKKIGYLDLEQFFDACEII